MSIKYGKFLLFLIIKKAIDFLVIFCKTLVKNQLFQSIERCAMKNFYIKKIKSHGF